MSSAPLRTFGPVWVSVFSMNGPAHAAESPNNVSLTFKLRGSDAILWLNRVGETLLGELCGSRPFSRDVGELLLQGTGDYFILFAPHANRQIELRGRHRREFILWFGELLGHSRADILGRLERAEHLARVS